MSDAMDHDAIRRYRKTCETCVSCFALSAPKLHLDEFVILEGAFRLGDDRRCDAGIADEKHWVQRVPQSTKIFALAL